MSDEMDRRIDFESIKENLKKNYDMQEELGHGGMGSVYMVKNRLDNQRYAAKIIWNSELGDGKEEAEILARLSHNMLPIIKEYFSYDTHTIIVMEYISGINMEQYICQNGPVNEKTAIHFLRQLCDVLMYLHSQEPPIIYRDLKPSNIMVEGKGRLKLIDFGIARRFQKASQNGNDTMALGTPGYAAPEQIMGDMQSDVRTDIYSLGATMYYIATGIDIGKPPFEAQPLHLVSSIMQGPLENIIARCLQRNPQSRYQSIADIISELDEKLYTVGKKSKGTTPINIMIMHSNKNII